MEKYKLLIQYRIGESNVRKQFVFGDYDIAYKAMMDKKCEYSCNLCGDCCRLATSEYSYNQLKQRAMRGDKFSADFVSVFVPYESEEDARKVNPEYFKLLNELVEDKIYYYYCPRLKDNLCSDYENRPDMLYVGDFSSDPQEPTNVKVAEFFGKASVRVDYD